MDIVEARDIAKWCRGAAQSKLNFSFCEAIITLDSELEKVTKERDQLIPTLKLNPHKLHHPNYEGECRCVQCEFVHASNEALAPYEKVIDITMYARTIKIVLVWGMLWLLEQRICKQAYTQKVMVDVAHTLIGKLH